MTHQTGQASLEDILITEQLFCRSPRTPDLKAENDALRTLARQLVEHPQTMLTTLVVLAKDLCQAGTAGVSLLEVTPDGEEIFRWVTLAGDLATYEQETVSRHSSLCAVCLDRQTPQLYSYPARYFTYLQSVEPAIVEGLLIPLVAANQPLGAIWIVSHNPRRLFDAEDVRIMTSLADFTAAALYNKQMEQALRQREVELSLVTNAVPVLISFVDSRQRYRFSNQTYEAWFGRSAAEVYGKSLWEVLGEAAYATIRPYVEQALAGQQVTFESEIPYQDGGTRFVSVTYVPRFDEQGTVEGFVALVNDISQRKRAEIALRQSEERLRIAQQAAKAGVWDWDIVTNQVTWSAEYYHLYGLNPATLQPSYDSWLNSIVESDRERTDRAAREALAHQTDLNVEFRILHPTQGERWITAIGQTFYNASQQPIRLTGIALDITERKQVEEALRQSESRFQTLVKNMPGMVYRYVPDPDSGDVFTYVSSGSRELFELEPETILQDANALWSLIHPDDLPSLQASVATAIAQESSWQWEGRVITPSGQMKWIQGKSRLEYIGSRAVWDGLLIDISEQQTALHAQRQADQRLHLLYETTSDLLATEHPMRLMNNLFRKLSVQLELDYYYNFMLEEKENRLMLHLKNYGGISEAVAQTLEWMELGQSLCGLVAQEQRPIILNQEQLASHPHAQLVCSSGATAYAGYPLMTQGRVLGTLSFASLSRSHFTPEEIDLLQSTCEQIAIAIERANLMVSIQQQAEQLQQANRIKDEFLAVLSHELRSPLNPILGWAKLLRSRKLNEAKTAEALATIERNAKLQAELIEDLLDVSRILQGKLSLNMLPVDLVSTIQAAMETVRLAAEAKSIQIQTDLDTSAGKVLGDAARIQQVIWNLLSNAVKFTPAGGRVEIRLEQGEEGDQVPVSSAPSAPSAYAQITVTDTGKGIAPSFLPHVFDYFRQADSTTTRQFGGLGLGLAISRHLVELHSGTIQVQSQGEGRGTTFTVRLPLLPPQLGTRQAEDESEQLLDLRGAKILVVDDDADTREFIAFLLEQAGASVTAVASASEAFVSLTQSSPDLLLSDIGMPEMDGYMLLQQVRTLPPEQGGTIPAIALTAYAGEIDYQQAMAAGFQRHVPKPVDPEGLLRTIASLMH